MFKGILYRCGSAFVLINRTDFILQTWGGRFLGVLIAKVLLFVFCESLTDKQRKMKLGDWPTPGVRLEGGADWGDSSTSEGASFSGALQVSWF